MLSRFRCRRENVSSLIQPHFFDRLHSSAMAKVDPNQLQPELEIPQRAKSLFLTRISGSFSSISCDPSTRTSDKSPIFSTPMMPFALNEAGKPILGLHKEEDHVGFATEYPNCSLSVWPIVPISVPPISRISLSSLK